MSEINIKKCKQKLKMSFFIKSQVFLNYLIYSEKTSVAYLIGN